jgi:hypothetical protein
MFRFLVVLALAVSINAYAGNVYVFKNKDGETLLTNSVENVADGELKVKSVKEKMFGEYKVADNNISSSFVDTHNLTNAQIIEKIKALKIKINKKYDDEGYLILLDEKRVYKNHIQAYQEELDKRILAAKPNVKIGMTAKQVAINTNWGRPDTVNRTTLKNGVHEQWVYPNKGYLYFDNGKLVAIQD